MSGRDLDPLFAPNSIAVFGASERPESVGFKVYANLLEGTFAGNLYAINPKYTQLLDKPCYPSLDAIGKSPDLAVIVTPARTVLSILQSCGQIGVKAAMILSVGFGETGEEGARLQEEAVQIAREHGMRMLGPNCLGVMRPRIGLNATFAGAAVRPGQLALVSQSGALCSAILDWSGPRHVGYSAMISLGDAADVDFGDVLDYLAIDPYTRAILLYVEGIRNARHFVSGLRAAARVKPVIVMKAGRHAEGSKAARAHTGAVVGADDVFDAALMRAGAVRAITIAELFAAAQLFSANQRAHGNRLAIVTNGGGLGVAAADRAVELGLQIATLSEATRGRLREVLPSPWSNVNPVNLLGDATPARYREALTACLADPNIDGVLVMLAPLMIDAVTAARAVTEVARRSEKPVLACWMGETEVAEARQLLAEAGLAQFSSPESAVTAFSLLVTYERNQHLLLQVPPPLADTSRPDIEGTRMIIEGALAESRRALTTVEASAVLSAFRIPVVEAMEAHTANEALVAAEALGFPVAMKISSPDIRHKSDVDGVRLDVEDAHSIRRTFNELVARAKRERPDATVVGVTVERMYHAPRERELVVGIVRDPVFGPVISFGAGGAVVELRRTRTVALPPLNDFIIEHLIKRARVEPLLGPFRNLPPISREGLKDVLQRVSEMACELPELVSLEIDPLVATDRGLVAIDVRIVVDVHTPPLDPYGHMAIHPYPAHMTESWQLADGTDVTLRPIRPEDAEIENEFVRNLPDESRYFRFLQNLKGLSREMLVRFTQIDYDREMALIGVCEEESRQVEIGVVRYITAPDGDTCEFAIVIADQWQRRGIGTRLMRALINNAKTRGLKTMKGEVLSNNTKMLGLMRKLGFTVHPHPDGPLMKIVTKTL
jgi:acetyltransferase